MRFDRFSFHALQWWQDTPNRALEKAYRAAIAIQKIEAEYFSGQAITANPAIDPVQNISVTHYLTAKRNQLLRTIRWRLAEFRVASAIIAERQSFGDGDGSGSALAIAPKHSLDYHTQQVLNRLTLIDQVLSRYDESELPLNTPTHLDSNKLNNKRNSLDPLQSETTTSEAHEHLAKTATKTPSIFNKSGFLPRSLLNTGRRLQQELRSNSEAEVVKAYQLSRFRTRRSFQFLAILLVVPLMTQQVSKNFVFTPIIEYFQQSQHIEIALNFQQEREAIEEIDLFEKKIRFEEKIGKIPRLSADDFEKLVTEKTIAIAAEHQHESLNAVENVFADITSVGMFVWILLVSQENIQILKSFMDELIYGLSDSAKAFVIILFTDVFVGFHSTHGWEIFLEAIANHFGIPENRNFIFLFIATFPVALDSIFKYWIFRYLSQISPSAVATYRNMNE